VSDLNNGTLKRNSLHKTRSPLIEDRPTARPAVHVTPVGYREMSIVNPLNRIRFAQPTNLRLR
jgi:hypothetical protein